MSPSVDPTVAGINPSAFALENQQAQANLASTQQQQGLRAQDIALRQQQVQGAQLENQVTQQALRDNQALTQAYSQYDPKSPTASDDLERTFVKAGGSGLGLMNLKQAQLGWRAKLQTYDENQLKIEDTVNGRTADALQEFKDQITKNPAQALQLWAQTYGPRMQQLHPDQRIDLNNPPVGATLDAQIGATAHVKDLVDNQLKAQQAKTSAVEAGKAEAETKGEEIKNQLAQAELAHYKTLMATPQALENYVEENIPRAQYPQLHDAAVSQARQQTDMKGVNAVVEKNAQTAREQERTLSVELDPQVAALRKKQEEDRANYQNALQQGDQARTKYFDSSNDVHQTLAAARSIEHIVELAQGNPIAGNQLELVVPEFTAAMQGIKPRGMQLNEKGFSSTWDRVYNEVQSAIPGKSSINASTLNQIMPYIRTIANGAVQNHNATVQTLNQPKARGGYGTNFPQEPTPYQNTANPKTVSKGLPKVATPADVAKLAKGTHFLDPNGVERIAQ